MTLRLRGRLAAMIAIALLAAGGGAAEEEPAPSADEQLAYRLLDAERSERDLPPLERDPRLERVARAHSQDMAEHRFAAHESPRTGDSTRRLLDARYWSVTHAENVALDASVADAHRGLMESKGHRRNILDPDMTRLGIGVVSVGAPGARRVYVTQLFARPAPRIDPEQAREQVRARIAAARDRRRLAPHRGDAALDRAALAAARERGISPQKALRLAQAEAQLGGTYAWVFELGELEQLELDSQLLRRRPGRLGVGVHQDPGRDSPNIVVVLLLASGG